MNKHSMDKNQTFTHNTVIIGDLHLADAEPRHPKKKFWKNFKRKEHFFDDSFQRFLKHIEKKSSPLPVELILNGDIFDYDAVLTIPNDPPYRISHLEKKTGLGSEEEKSLFKTHVILEQHPIFMDALKAFVANGNKVVFVIGNHDIELHWPSVQQAVVSRITSSSEQEKQIVFCEWFYVSQADTLVEHGNQYDPYSMCLDPINPIIVRNNNYKIRIPFGDLAGRFIVNRLGLKNPNDESSYVKSAMEYFTFFIKYEMKVEPFMVFHWLFGSLRALRTSLIEGFTPAVKDPLTYHTKVKEIATKANTSVNAVLALKELHAHPAVHSPFKIIRELWLDRFFLLVLIIGISWQVFTTYSLFAGISIWVFIIPLLISLPFFAYYSQGVTSDVYKNLRAGEEKASVAAQIVGVHRVVHGHTHQEKHEFLDDVEFLNPSSWSPYFEDVECTVDKRVKKYIWIEVKNNKRSAEVLTWEGPQNNSKD